jgi:sugar phosphate permease
MMKKLTQLPTAGATVVSGGPKLGGAYAWFVWGLAVAFVVYLFSFQTGYSIVNPEIQKAVGLTVGQIGAIAATYTWAFALCQFFSGALLDRLGARKVIAPAIGIVALGIFVFAHSSSYPALLGAQVVIALGASAGFVGAGYVGGHWFGMAKFSFMFGLVQFSASLFSTFSQNLFGIALHHLDWRNLFSAIAAGGLVLFVLGLAFIRDPAPIASSGASRGVGNFLRNLLSSIVEVAKIPHVWLVAIWGSMVFGAMLAAGVIWASKLLVIRGMSQGTADFAASLLWLGLAIGCLVIPKWSDVIRRRKLPTAVGISVQLAAMLTLLYMPAIPAAGELALCFLFGVGAASHMLAFSTAGDVVPQRLIGTSAAIVNGVMFLVSGVLIALPGQIATPKILNGAKAGMALADHAALPMIIGITVALVLALFMKETYPKRRA